MKLSGQSSLYIAEYLKTVLKQSKKYYEEIKHKTESEIECVTENEIKNEKIVASEEKPEVKLTDMMPNGSYKKVKDPNLSIYDSSKNIYNRRKSTVPNNFENSNTQDTNLIMKHKVPKRNHDSTSYVSILRILQRVFIIYKLLLKF